MADICTCNAQLQPHDRMPFACLDAELDRLEEILQPRGRCTVCGGGEFYWKHDPSRDGFHFFMSPKGD